MKGCAKSMEAILSLVYSICYVIALMENFQDVENLSLDYLYIVMDNDAIILLRIAAVVIKLLINFI